MALRLVIVGGLVALLVGVGVAGAQSKRRQEASNLVAATRFVAVVEGGKAVCQRLERIPAGVGALRVLIGTYGAPGPDVGVRITAPGAPPVDGRLARGFEQGDVLVPVPTTDRPRENARVCLRNLGTARIALGGADADPSQGLRLGGKPLAARYRIEYVGPERTSWWGLSGTLVDRAASLRSATPGSATLVLWAVLLVAVVGGVVTTMLREGRE